MMTKKFVLFTALAILIFVFVISNPLIFGFCKNIEVYNEVMRRCVGGSLLPEHILQLIGLLSISLLLLSLITYKMRDEVFRAWWRFARWFVPIIIAVTLLLQNAGGSGGFGIESVISAGFNIMILSIFYAIFIVISLVKIFNMYFKTKKT